MRTMDSDAPRPVTTDLEAPPARGVAPTPPSRVPRRVQRILSLEDLEPAARAFLPRPVFEFVSGGAETNASRTDNRAAFAELGFLPRVLTDVSKRSQGASLFGRTYATPFGLAPMGMSALAAYRGDLVLARAAAAANIPMIMSGSSLIPLEDVRREGGPTTWYQAYLPGEPARIEPLVDRVIAAGFDTFVLTIDVPTSANRENNVRNGYALPLRPNPRLFWEGISHPRWLFGTALRTLLR